MSLYVAVDTLFAIRLREMGCIQRETAPQGQDLCAFVALSLAFSAGRGSR